MCRSYAYRMTIGLVIWKIFIRLVAFIAIGAIIPMIPEEVTPVANTLILMAVVAMLVTFVKPGIITKRSLRGREQTIKELNGNSNAAVYPRLTNNMELRQLFAGSYKPIFTAGNDKWCYADILYKAAVNKLLPLFNLDIEETRYTSVLEIRLPRELPAMLFKSKRQRGSAYVFIDQSQRTSLDVNFDDYFITYFPHHYHIDARSVISPEVMTAMIDMPACDIEINGSSLFFYPGFLPDNEIAAFIEKAIQVEKVLSDHVVHYRDELLNDTSNRQSVSVAGESLRQSSIVWLVAAVVLLVISALLFMLWLQSGDDKWRRAPLYDLKYCIFSFLLGLASILQSRHVRKANRQKDLYHQEQRRKTDS